MKLVYVAGPYRAKQEAEVVRNIRAAETLAIQLWKMGVAVICPHKNTALFGGLCPDETWLNGDLEMIRRCDAVVLTHDWEQSEGARVERAEAEYRGLPVFVATPGGSIPPAFVKWLKGDGRDDIRTEDL